MSSFRPVTIILLLLCIQSCFAQSTQRADSLLMIKKYLLGVQKSVNMKQTKMQKIITLDTLIAKGIKEEQVLQRNIARRLKESANQQDELLRTFHFIVQSLALYKSDLKSEGASPLEDRYLNEKIPVLIKLIDRYRDIDDDKKKRN